MVAILGEKFWSMVGGIPGQLGLWTTRPVDSSARSGQLGPYIADNSARSGELHPYM